ncbi:hypothetical protein LCGC14_0903130 [marine sediment metagenome]|uniref:Bbp19-like phage domain-containing protein n=1 Tax=marine sediment metagenome TaxID=412755 RepID=A0A0F9REU3_9ZZZZ
MNEQKQPDVSKKQAFGTLAKKTKRFHKLFTSPIGKQVLQDLEDEFNQDQIFDPNSDSVTAHNLGQRDVVIYINQMIRNKDNAARRSEMEG